MSTPIRLKINKPRKNIFKKKKLPFNDIENYYELSNVYSISTQMMILKLKTGEFGLSYSIELFNDLFFLFV